MKKSLFNCTHSLRRTEPRRHNSGQNKPPIRLGNDKKPFLWGSAAHQEALSVAAQRHSSRPAVKQTLQAAAGKLSSQGQPKKKKTSPSHNPPGRAGGKTAGWREKGRWKRAEASCRLHRLITDCVCVCDRYSACYPACRGGQWGQRLWVVTSCPLAAEGLKKGPHQSPNTWSPQATATTR